MANYHLSVGSVTLLRNLIGLPGTAKTVDEMYRAGKLLVVTIPDVKDKPVDDPVEFEMDGPDRDFCKTAITLGLTKEVVHNSKYSYELVTALELVSIPKPPA